MLFKETMIFLTCFLECDMMQVSIWKEGTGDRPWSAYTIRK